MVSWYSHCGLVVTQRVWNHERWRWNDARYPSGAHEATCKYFTSTRPKVILQTKLFLHAMGVKNKQCRSYKCCIINMTFRYQPRHSNISDVYMDAINEHRNIFLMILTAAPYAYVRDLPMYSLKNVEGGDITNVSVVNYRTNKL